ncbi:MAG: hypothetical protein F4018_14965 [Acidobacteria bacterium]|nr:hypothetical protein [Acidobacteriota bacterium]MYH30711.1 hypothetical protein [Acidobacteriota bacterium]MYK89524.1 hypothetical protein [Acidobacteriota bacterium]
MKDRLITRRTAMERFDFPSTDAVRMFAKRHGVRAMNRGRLVVYDPRDFERLVAPASGVFDGGVRRRRTRA